MNYSYPFNRTLKQQALSGASLMIMAVEIERQRQAKRIAEHVEKTNAEIAALREKEERKRK